MKTSNKILFFQFISFILLCVGFMIFLKNNLEPNPWAEDYTYKFSNVDKVDVEGSMWMSVLPAKESSLLINASQSIDEIADVKFNDDVLKISTKGKGSYDAKHLMAYAKLEDLKNVKGSGDSRLVIKNYELNRLDADVENNCFIEVHEADIDTLFLNMEDASKAYLKGEINVLYLNAKDSTEVNVEDLYVNEIVVDLKGDASLKVGGVDEISGSIPDQSAVSFKQERGIENQLEIANSK